MRSGNAYKLLYLRLKKLLHEHWSLLAFYVNALTRQHFYNILLFVSGAFGCSYENIESIRFSYRINIVISYRNHI
jgi:hypothetical protein